MAFIEISGLFKEYGKFQALRGIDLRVEKGEFISIIGPSGAGKSTFLRCINSTILPTSGAVRVGDTLVNELHGKRLFEHRARIGFIFQQFNLVKNLSVLQNVLVGRIVYNPLWRVMLGMWTNEDLEIAEHFISGFIHHN